MTRKILGVCSLLLLCCSISMAAETDLPAVFNYYMASQYIDLSGNIALGKPSFQSSERRYSYGSPDKGNEGLIGQSFSDGTCIHTNANANGEWWTVDLGENATVVKTVKLFNRLDSNKAKDLVGVEIRVGNETVSGAGDQNPLCNYSVPELVYEYPGETPYYPTLFRCDDSVGRFVTVRIATGKQLQVCEVMVFSEDKSDEWIMKPHLVDDGEGGKQCPSPLLETCNAHKATGMSANDAAVKAMMEGPIDCGGKGFFCRVKKDAAGKNGGMTGGPGDDFVGNENFGYCVDRAEDRQIDWNRLYRQPNNNDGHCHGSEFDDVYIGVLHDHYYRPYRGTLECCCGIEQRDGEDEWAPAKDYISRCDYRGRNGNDNNENFENGCGSDMLDFFQPEEFPNKEEMCWTMDNFGRPYEYLYGRVAPYATPKLEVPFCQGGENDDWHGCVIQVDTLAYRNSIVMISPEKVEPRMIDDIADCDDIYDIEISEVGLELFKFDEMDRHGHETEFVRINIPAGKEAHIQVIDTYSCAVSDLVTVQVPESSPDEENKKKLRKMLR